MTSAVYDVIVQFDLLFDEVIVLHVECSNVVHAVPLIYHGRTIVIESFSLFAMWLASNMELRIMILHLQLTASKDGEALPRVQWSAHRIRGDSDFHSALPQKSSLASSCCFAKSTQRHQTLSSAAASRFFCLAAGCDCVCGSSAALMLTLMKELPVERHYCVATPFALYITLSTVYTLQSLLHNDA